MIDRGNSMGPHGGNRPPIMVLAAGQRGKTRLPPCPSTSRSHWEYRDKRRVCCWIRG